ncbi:MAG: hypothetical protein K0R02_998 [Rickettsiaceae bacterium]|jgi:hypothetical protein|nr:hypothetical protein [Rickettsiaceae bacterium]
MKNAINETLVNQIKLAIQQDDKDTLANLIGEMDISNIQIAVNRDGFDSDISILFYASLQGAINCFKYLVEEKGVDLYLKNENGSIFLNWLGDSAESILNYAIEKS